MTNKNRLIKRCWLLAEAYRQAGAYRGRCEAAAELRPDDVEARADRLDAGIDEGNAWLALVKATNELMPLAGWTLAITIRHAASVANGNAVVRAIKVGILQGEAA